MMTTAGQRAGGRGCGSDELAASGTEGWASPARDWEDGRILCPRLAQLLEKQLCSGWPASCHWKRERAVRRTSAGPLPTAYANKSTWRFFSVHCTQRKKDNQDFSEAVLAASHSVATRWQGFLPDLKKMLIYSHIRPKLIYLNCWFEWLNTLSLSQIPPLLFFFSYLYPRVPDLEDNVVFMLFCFFFFFLIRLLSACCLLNLIFIMHRCDCHSCLLKVWRLGMCPR